MLVTQRDPFERNCACYNINVKAPGFIRKEAGPPEFAAINPGGVVRTQFGDPPPNNGGTIAAKPEEHHVLKIGSPGISVVDTRIWGGERAP
jgi:hypothetical protein